MQGRHLLLLQLDAVARIPSCRFRECWDTTSHVTCKLIQLFYDFFSAVCIPCYIQEVLAFLPKLTAPSCQCS